MFTMQRAHPNRYRNFPHNTNNHFDGLIRQNRRPFRPRSQEREVLVLLMYWESDAGDAGVPLAAAEDIFVGAYGFTVEHLPITLRDPVDGIQRELRKYHAVTSRRDCLVIVYYVGHGILGSNMQYHMGPDR